MCPIGSTPLFDHVNYIAARLTTEEFDVAAATARHGRPYVPLPPTVSPHGGRVEHALEPRNVRAIGGIDRRLKGVEVWNGGKIDDSDVFLLADRSFSSTFFSFSPVNICPDSIGVVNKYLNLPRRNGEQKRIRWDIRKIRVYV